MKFYLQRVRLFIRWYYCRHKNYHHWVDNRCSVCQRGVFE